MRKVILNLAATLDGFIEGPNGELDWLVRDETIDFADILTEILSDKDATFYGRVSYEKWGNFIPPEASQKLRQAYDLMHGKKKYVFSRSKKGDETDAVFINSDISQVVKKLKAQPGKNIWLYGGSQFITTFLNLDLIDEYRLAVHPVIIGKGKPLFDNIRDRHRLKLVDARPFPSGVTLLSYMRSELL
jgi:dihydrofolate reductase